MASDQPVVCGWRKKDLGVKEARLVAVVDNLDKKDKVKIRYPRNRSHPYLKIEVNGHVIKEKYIPDDVIEEECKSKIKHRRKDAEIKITLRKQTNGLWDNRWSPSHDGLHGNPLFPPFPSSTAASGSDSSSAPDGKLTITELPVSDNEEEENQASRTTGAITDRSSCSSIGDSTVARDDGSSSSSESGSNSEGEMEAT